MKKALAFQLGLVVAILAFGGYQYFMARSSLFSVVDGDFSRIQLISQELVRLENGKLESVARSLASGPLLRGALQARHRPTLEAVMAGIRESNGLEHFTVEFQEEKAAIGSREGAVFSGRASERFAGDPLRVEISQPVSNALLTEWKKSLGADLLLRLNGKAQAATVLAADWIEGEEGGLKTVAGQQAAYYWKELSLPGWELSAYLPKARYKDAQRRERNRFLFFSVIVLALGTVLAFAFPKIFGEEATAMQGVSREEWERLLKEIESRSRP